MLLRSLPGGFSKTINSRSGSRQGDGLSNTASITLKMAVLAHYPQRDRHHGHDGESASFGDGAKAVSDVSDRPVHQMNLHIASHIFDFHPTIDRAYLGKVALLWHG